MPRGFTTQTRTFVYKASPSGSGTTVGPFLISATNPENGTVTNSYNGDTTLNYKIDAKGQKIAYTYDSYKRVTQISKYPDGVNEDVCQRVTYNYDSNPDTTNSNYTQYLAGRLASVHYAGAGCSSGGNNYVEMHAYSQAWQVTRKTFRLKKGSASGDLEAVYTYDQEGKMASQSHPLGTTYNYAYDTMGRPTKMTDAQTTYDLVSAVTYGPAGELLSMTGNSVNETRTYNANGQLTQLIGIGMNLTYNYPAAGSNNGQIASQYDATSGETTTYSYDSLKRLASATSTGWGQGFTYDGFGNLTAKYAISGNPPVGNYPADPATNRLYAGYDANGNQTSFGSYDVSNRMISTNVNASGQAFFEYDAYNERIYQQKQHYDGNNWVSDSQEYYFYGITAQKLGAYIATATNMVITFSVVKTQVFFGSKLVNNGTGSAQEDIRASVGSYYPYGEDRNSTANDTVKFGTYTRDGISGLDYAFQRYYTSVQGRFTTPDPLGGSVAISDPQSWNRYSYVGGDPVNKIDPTGLCGEYSTGAQNVFCVTGSATAYNPMYSASQIYAILGSPFGAMPQYQFSPGGGGQGGGAGCQDRSRRSPTATPTPRREQRPG